MAVATYATRAGGLFLIGRVEMSPRLQNWLSYIPGCVLLSIVAPSIYSGGVPGALASLITLLVALRTRNLLLAMIAGVASVVILRAVLPV
jgi:uncharacterized membrane protein